MIQGEIFRLQGNKALYGKERAGRTFVVDVTERPIECLSKRQKKFYSGKKKRHTIKIQLLIDACTREILCTARSRGSVHDFALFERSVRGMFDTVTLLADSGYSYLLGVHTNSRFPFMKSKKHLLTAEQKKFNRELSKERVVIENVNARLKAFKIMSERYRNRRKRHSIENKSTLCDTQ